MGRKIANLENLAAGHYWIRLFQSSFSIIRHFSWQILLRYWLRLTNEVAKKFYCRVNVHTAIPAYVLVYTVIIVVFLWKGIMVLEINKRSRILSNHRWNGEVATDSQTPSFIHMLSHHSVITPIASNSSPLHVAALFLLYFLFES